MKIRLDYVTNSSSSSYIVAVKDSKTEEQIREFNKICVEWVKKLVLDGTKITTIEQLNKCVENEGWDIDGEDSCDYEKYNKCKKLIENGYVIIKSYLDWESIEDTLMEEYNELFNKLEKNTKSFIGVETDLSY